MSSIFSPFLLLKSGQNWQKHKAYIALTFRSFLATFIFEKVDNIDKKSKAIAFTFSPFSATFPIFHKWTKNSKIYIAFTFRPFLVDFSIFQKEAKNSKKVTL